VKILFKYPSRSRSELFSRTFAKWRDQVSGKHEYIWLFTFDEDDPELPRYLDIVTSFKTPQKGCDKIIHNINKKRGKIAACNYGLRTMKEIEWDIVHLLADDLFPIVDNYDDTVAKEMKIASPDNRPMALHFPDGQGSMKFFQPIMNRSLFDKLGYIYNPCYVSVWCDNELTDICRELKAYKHFPNRLIIVHPWIEYTGQDDLNKHNENRKINHRDHKTYKHRRKLRLKKKMKPAKPK